MVFIAKDLSEISTKVHKQLNLVEQELKQLPQGRLVCENQGGRLRFVNETYENGKRRRRNLPPEDPMLIGLLRRCILEKELQQLLANSMLLKCATDGIDVKRINAYLDTSGPDNKELLNLITSGIRDFDLTDELYNLRIYFLQHKFSGNQSKGKSTVKHSGQIKEIATGKHQTKGNSPVNEKEITKLLDELFEKTLHKNESDNWANEPYEKLQYQDDRTKWQITSFGLRVRSKSELMIAEMLHKYGISFRYEQMLRFDNSSLAPDFTIRRDDGKIIYWEHEGLTNSNEYLNRQLKKSQIYAMNNIVPWDNLIITYDNSSGLIDMRIVESEIQNKLLI